MPIHTPWGPSQHAHAYAEGVVFHETASHGGFHLDYQRNAKVHPALRNADGWYEEDCEAAKIIASFPSLFSEDAARAAHRTLKNWFPDAYEQIYGVALMPGESIRKDEQRFHEEHAQDWIVTSAIASKERPGFVECFARKGGTRGTGITRRFLVPEAAYRTRGPLGFVIDEARHAPCDGPDSRLTRPR